MVGFEISVRIRKSPVVSDTNFWIDRPKRRSEWRVMSGEHHERAYAKHYFKMVNSKIIAHCNMMRGREGLEVLHLKLVKKYFMKPLCAQKLRRQVSNKNISHLIQLLPSYTYLLRLCIPETAYFYPLWENSVSF